VEAYRGVLIPTYYPSPLRLAIFAALSLVCFIVGCGITRRFKSTIIDYE
jgi:hypothetical protein